MTESSKVDPQNLRVAIFSDSLPERNGAGAYYNDLAGQLAKRLESLELYQPMPRKWFDKLAPPLLGDSTQKLKFPNVFRLANIFKKQRPHLVIAVTPGPFGLFGMWMARRSGAGFISAFHTHFEGLVQMYGDTLAYRIAHWYLVRANRILFRRSDTVLINNEGLVPTINKLGATRHDIMGTPLSREFLEPELVPPSGKLRRILFAGRLAPEKNLGVIMDAARAKPDLEFVIVGEGPLKKELQRQCEALPNVRMTGWLDRPGLREEVDKADLLILPSHLETFGTVALEAMSRGRPALVSANAGIHEWEELKHALFKLNKEDNLGDILDNLEHAPPEVWDEKARSARQAAVSLNNLTIDQWVGFIENYARAHDE